jgi:hypothetical protein
MKNTLLVAISALLILLVLRTAADDEHRVDIAQFNQNGDLIVPGDLDEWVFIGSSLGMGYSQDSFDADSPGMFQIARMEPNAYRLFKETGKFVDGTMLSLHFYGSQNEVSINRAGFVMSDLHFAEIHYKDSNRFPDGFNFYNLSNGDPVGREIALPNDCVDCHKRDGAYDGVFVQFYPAIHQFLPEAVRASLAENRQGGSH